LDSPAAILVQIQTLGLSGKQKLKLLKVEKQARQKALAVLTPEQRRKLGDVSAPPVSMASLCRKMCGKMMAGTSKDSQTRTVQQTICPVMGGKINRNISTAYKGKKVYFCCAGCIGKFKANPEKYLNKLPQFKEAKPAKKEKVVSVGTEQKVCPIMGESINKAVFTVYKGKKVYFCCPGCKPEFEKNPEKFLAKLPQFKK
jgi:YHS domain-containing protein